MDYIALGAIGAGILTLVVVGVLWRQREVGTPQALAHDVATVETGDPPTFRVVALGLEGAGKTVLLSSLFYKLNFRSPTRSYHLEAQVAEAALLANIRKQILDTNAGWPASTTLAEDREFGFDYVSYDAAGDRRTILRMNYLEYAGEIFAAASEQRTAKLKELERQVNGAHALLGLIDGFRLRQLLLGDEDAEQYFDAELLPMIGFMQHATCPIQLVITKWDVLQDLGDGRPVDDGIRFGEVKEALMKIPQIRALVDFGGPRKMRIIPVSAVGRHFAKLIDEKEPPVKQPGARLRPINIDVPLCAVLPDLLRQVEQSLDSQFRRKLLQYMRGRLWQDVRSLVTTLLRSPAGAVLRGASEALVFVEWMIERTPAKGRVRRSAGSDRELERLRAELIAHMEQQVRHLESTLPDSVC